MEKEAYRDVQDDFFDWLVDRGVSTSTAAVYVSNLGRFFFRGMRDLMDVEGLLRSVKSLVDPREKTKARALYRRYAEFCFETKRGVPLPSSSLDDAIPALIGGRRIKGAPEVVAQMEDPKLYVALGRLFGKMVRRAVDRTHSITPKMAASASWGQVRYIAVGSSRWFALNEKMGIPIGFLDAKDMGLLLDVLDATRPEFGRKINPTFEIFIKRFESRIGLPPPSARIFPLDLNDDAKHMTPGRLQKIFELDEAPRNISIAPVETVETPVVVEDEDVEDEEEEEDEEIEVESFAQSEALPLLDLLGAPGRPPVDPFGPKPKAESKSTIRLADLLPPDRE